MSRKHFVILAKLISTLPDQFKMDFARAIGEICQNSNPNFNWFKWNNACKVD